MSGQLPASVASVEGAAGSSYYTIRLRSTATTTCYLYGYPGVSLVGHGNGTQIGAAAARDYTVKPVTVTLKPGASTTFSLRIVEALNYPTATCRPTPTDGLRIYPPDSTTALFLPLSHVTGCASSAVNLLTVRPVGVSAG